VSSVLYQGCRVLTFVLARLSCQSRSSTSQQCTQCKNTRCVSEAQYLLSPTILSGTLMISACCMPPVKAALIKRCPSMTT